MRFSTAVVAALCLAPLAAGAANSEGSRQISGTVTYDARMALPPGAVLTVEARTLEGQTFAHQVLATEGAQVPLSFALDIPVRQNAVLTAAIYYGNGARWIMPPVTVTPDVVALDVGEQKLHAFAGIGLNAAYLCGDTRVATRVENGRLLLASGAPRPQLSDLAADAAGRFLTADGQTSAVFSGEQLQLTQAGAALDCAPVPPAERASWSAAGDGWSATLAEGRLSLQRPGLDEVSAALPAPALAEGWLHYSLNEADQPPLVLSLTPVSCTAASGVTYPDQSSLLVNGESQPGCGGDPAELLMATGWTVVSIGGAEIGGTKPTLTFDAEGSVFGTGSCNRYTGGYKMTEKGLTIGQVASTMMACGQSAMDQERAFHQALAQVTGFTFAEDGALVLMGGETELLRAMP